MAHRLLFWLSTCSLALLYWLGPIFAEVPETAKIAFWADRGGTRAIYLMNPDGTDQVKITQHHSQNITPVWSPTGEHILFVSDRDGVWDLYLMDPDGSNVRRVFEEKAERAGPTWSPDGKQIAYIRTVREQWVNYIAAVDEKNEERMAVGSFPTWSPDGTEIAFLVGWPNSMQISIFNVATHEQEILFPPKVIPSYMGGGLTWSPTGDKLAFAWQHRVPFKDFHEAETVYTINRDGTELTQLIEEAGPRATSPVWSPGGDALLYQRSAGHRSYQIFKMSLNGGKPEQLTDIGWNHLGDWFDPLYALPVSPQSHLLTTTWAEAKKK